MGGGKWDKTAKNYGGGHTGKGKKRGSSIYSMNGFRKQSVHPNRDFKEGIKVSYIGCHKRFMGAGGIVVSKKGDIHSSMRSQIKIRLDDQRTIYIHRNNLSINN